MSVAIHADNSAQAEYWSCVAGPKWTENQEHQDQVLRPVSDRLIAATGLSPRRSQRRAIGWSTSAAAAAPPQSTSQRV
jgi:hypothetical protein